MSDIRHIEDVLASDCPDEDLIIILSDFLNTFDCSGATGVACPVEDHNLASLTAVACRLVNRLKHLINFYCSIKDDVDNSVDISSKLSMGQQGLLVRLVDSLRLILRWKSVINFDMHNATSNGWSELDNIARIMINLAVDAVNSGSNHDTGSFDYNSIVMACVRCLVNALINDERRILSFCGVDVDGIGKLSLILSITNSRTRQRESALGPLVMKLQLYIVRLVYMMIAQW